MQSTNNILLIRPSGFIFNTETANSNAFQNKLGECDAAITQKATDEFEIFVNKLIDKKINVIVVDDTITPQKPDAIFPNNWISFHADGRVILYPMYAPNRRYERRQDIIEIIKKKFIIHEIIDLTAYENDNRFLEGTGSVLFDHENKIAYACLSPRTDKEIFIEVCNRLDYQPVYFFSYDKHGKEIYHTNVMMCIGTGFCVICLESITDRKQQELVAGLLKKTGHIIIDISFEQVKQFAGNMLELKTQADKNILALSQSAFESLTATQKYELEIYCELVPLPITTIETIGGGSARCMIAEIFLKKIQD